MKRFPALVLLAAAVCVVSATCGAAGDGLYFGFESGQLDEWAVVEGGFGQLVCGRAVFHHTGEPYNNEGAFFLSTLETPEGRPNDRYQGVVESPLFVLEGPRMSFLAGGGKHPETHVALCGGNGREIVTASGDNAQKMRRVEWNLPECVGKCVFVRVVDRHTGGWGHVTFDDFRAAGRIDTAATSAWRAQRTARLLRAQAEARLDALGLDRADAALRTQNNAQDRLECLAAVQEDAAKLRARLADMDAAQLEAALEEIQRYEEDTARLLLADPLLDTPVLFVRRAQYAPDHHNTATLFQTGEINTENFTGPSALMLWTRNGARTLLESPGVIRDPEVSYDGERILFSMRRDIRDDYHVYEMNTDGTGLRQLTFAPGVSDIDPVYLPDGGIVFSSTREPKYCMCNRHIMANLFRMDADGANIHQIGKSTLFEGHSAILPDGRILYDRWEYVDRNFGDAQGLWTINPDGTNQAVYYGNNTWSPGGVIDARPIPGTQRVVCVFGSCHDRPWGALAMLDRRLGVDGRSPVLRTWPAGAIELVDEGANKPNGHYGFDLFTKVSPKYEDPYPLSEHAFLCSRQTGRGEEMGIYLVDVFGNETLVHDEAPGCYDPMPLAPRSRPPVIPARRRYDTETGRLYVADVYEGTHMEGVEPGAVKFLRVVESPEKRFWTHPSWNGQGVHCPAMNWHDFCNKRILGTVPVEPDGSAHFEVPADTFVYFQLLDENGMMVQSMRSGTVVQPGETTGCTGCHEHRLSSPPPGGSETLMAMQRPPSPLNGWHGEPRLFNYLTEVQPVFDEHCVRCHDYGEKPGRKLNLAGDPALTFNASYIELWRKGHLSAIGAGPSAVQPAYSWGSHASRLVETIRSGHEDVELSPEEFDRLVTWIDLNAPYYPRYASAYPENLTGRAPLSPEQLKRLAALTGVDFAALARHDRKQGPQVSFARPELSPCLEGLKKKDRAAYREALDIIRAGKQNLAKRPRADMEGFQPAAPDAQRERKYQQRLAAEQRNRAAIVQGARAYDARPE